MANYTRLYPWTLRHPAVRSLTFRARIAYVELLADTGSDPDRVDANTLAHLTRKDHRETLIEAGLIRANGDGTYAVIQPSDPLAALGSA
ncbi:hypothetical protein ACK8HH_17280 [Gordonia sp. LUNF6]|nr:hypothetical protein Y710_09575 [Gordonia sp. QH-12]